MDGPVEQCVPRCNCLHHKISMKQCEYLNLNFVLVKVKNVTILFFIKPYEGNPREMKAYNTRIKSSDTCLLGHCVQEQSGILLV